MRLTNRARVVVNDAPSLVWEVLQHEREDSADITLSSAQMPVPKNQSGVGAEQADFEGGKIELPHGGAVRIILPVAHADRVEPPGYPVAARKR